MALMIFVSMPPLIVNAQDEAPARDKITIQTQNDGKKYDVIAEIAGTPDAWEKGLMGRESLGEGEGMLFVFPRPQQASFWMKDTLIPLDMIFAKVDGTIVQIDKEAKPNDLTPHVTNEPVSLVLEVKGGEAERMGLKVGDKLVKE